MHVAKVTSQYKRVAFKNNFTGLPIIIVIETPNYADSCPYYVIWPAPNVDHTCTETKCFATAEFVKYLSPLAGAICRGTQSQVCEIEKFWSTETLSPFSHIRKTLLRDDGNTRSPYSEQVYDILHADDIAERFIRLVEDANTSPPSQCERDLEIQNVSPSTLSEAWITSAIRLQSGS
uniref:Uncharacterized protein n=1 Tax=Ascaris lumbricoides TaxID=6252 RepID=A0A0M3I4N0_ASCLU